MAAAPVTVWLSAPWALVRATLHAAVPTLRLATSPSAAPSPLATPANTTGNEVAPHLGTTS